MIRDKTHSAINDRDRTVKIDQTDADIILTAFAIAGLNLAHGGFVGRLKSLLDDLQWCTGGRS